MEFADAGLDQSTRWISECSVWRRSSARGDVDLWRAAAHCARAIVGGLFVAVLRRASVPGISMGYFTSRGWFRGDIHGAVCRALTISG